MFDRCVCFGLLFTSDDDLDRTFILKYFTYGTFSSAYLLIPINGLLHVGLKPSIYGRAARLWTECTQPGGCLSHSPFQQMYVRTVAERSLSGTLIYLLLVDAPNRANSMNEIFHTGLEPLRDFVCSYPLDGILRASGERCRPINGILSNTTSTFTDQPRLC